MIREKLAAKSSELFEAKREIDRLREMLREHDRDAAMQGERTRQLESLLDERDRRISDILITNEQLAAGAERQQTEARSLAKQLEEKDTQIDSLRNHVARCESAVQEARDGQAQTESDCEFKLSIVEESKTSLMRELEIAREELGNQQEKLNEQCVCINLPHLALQFVHQNLAGTWR